MAKQKKEKDQEKNSKIHTSSGGIKGGRGGSFGEGQPSVPQSNTLSYPSAGDMSVAKTFQNLNTLRQFAQAQRGLNAYTADQQQNTARMPVSYAPSDAPAIVHSFHNAVNTYAADDSYAEINQNWTFDQKMNFGYLYDTSPAKAKDYAVSVNDVIAKTLTQPGHDNIHSKSTKSVGSGAVHTAAALGISVLSPMAELLDRAAEFSARGRITEKPYITPWDYSREVRSAIRDHLNTHTLDEDIPILGGKGLGDLYDLGYGVAESWLSANTIGRAFGVAGKLAGTLAVTANSFARSATSAMDAARRSGADGKQSVSFDITMGLLEAAADALPTDSLLRITPKTTVKDFLEDALKHGALEGLTETLSEGLGQVAQYRILGNDSTFSRRCAAYIRQGYAPEEASRKALRDSFFDLGFTMLAGTAAGTVAAGTQSVLEDRLAAIRACDAALKENEYSISELFQLRRELQYISQSYERFSPEGQQRWQARSDRYNELMGKWEVSRKAQQERQTHLEAYRKELDEHGYQMPFTPELYRMALEMSTPDGWDTEGVDSVWNLMQVESPGQTGEKAIPYSERGIEIEPRIVHYMEQLPQNGTYITDRANSFSMEDIQIMTAETGVEFTLLEIGEDSYMIRGNERGTTIPNAISEKLYNQKGSFVCHSHPYIGDLKPSQSDIDFLISLTWQTESIIIDPSGEMVVYDQYGIKEKKSIATERNQSYYDELFPEE